MRKKLEITERELEKFAGYLRREEREDSTIESYLRTARRFAACRDVVRLADVLGHSSIEMTRIYLLSTAKESVRQLDRLGLLSGWA